LSLFNKLFFDTLNFFFTMIKNLLLFFLTLIALSTNAQVASFLDDFENYNVGDYVAKTNNKWTTWSNKPGTTEDAKITDEKARSGTKSAKFSSTSATGGPTDLVLPFFGSLSAVKNAGIFESSMWFYVPSGATAYFNYQAVAPVGKTWILDVHFESDNTFTVASTGSGGLQGKTTFESDTWVKYSCNIDLTTNTWKIALNDIEIANFSTPINSLFALNIYPLDASSLFYVDDVETKFAPFAPKTSDAAVTLVDMKKRALNGKQYITGGTFRNLGTTTITAMDIKVLDGATTPNVISLSNLNVLPLGFYSFQSPSFYIADANNNKLGFEIVSVNGKADDDITNDKKELTIDVVVPAPGKKVIAEQATGTWCQWCPRGHVNMTLMEKEYGDYFIGVAGHSNDPMQLASYTNSIVGSGYPSVWVDRKINDDPGSLESYFFERVRETPHAKVENSVKYHTGKKEITVDVKVTFNSAVKSGNYKLVALVLEDSIRGTAAGYRQANAYANNAAGVMGGYEKLPNPVPANKMVYEHVARAVLTDLEGDDLAANPKDGDIVTKTYTFTVPSTYIEKQLEVVSFVLDDNGNGTNGARSTYRDFAVTVGSNDIANNHPYFQGLFPNPASDVAYVDLNVATPSNIAIEVSDVTGKIIASREYGQIAGEQLFPLPCTDWAKGVYMVRISIGDKFITKKLVKE
jgi:hypothetical protein